MVAAGHADDQRPADRRDDDAVDASRVVVEREGDRLDALIDVVHLHGRRNHGHPVRGPNLVGRLLVVLVAAFRVADKADLLAGIVLGQELLHLRREDRRPLVEPKHFVLDVDAAADLLGEHSSGIDAEHRPNWLALGDQRDAVHQARVDPRLRLAAQLAIVIVGREVLEVFGLRVDVVAGDLAARVEFLDQRGRLHVQAPRVRPFVQRAIGLSQADRRVKAVGHRGEPVVLVGRVAVAEHAAPRRAAMLLRRVAQARVGLVKKLLLDEGQFVETDAGVLGRAQLLDVVGLVKRDKVDLAMDRAILEGIAQLVAHRRAISKATVCVFRVGLKPGADSRAFQVRHRVADHREARIPNAVFWAWPLFLGVAADAQTHGFSLAAADRSADVIHRMIGEDEICRLGAADEIEDGTHGILASWTCIRRARAARRIGRILASSSSSALSLSPAGS